MTMTVRYDAVIAAADHIERQPGSFDFFAIRTPFNLNMRGCALGWIGYFAGFSKDSEYASDVAQLFCVDEHDFFCEMTKLAGLGWMGDPKKCARGLRLYAESHLYFESLPVWAQMRERETQARLDAAPAYSKFRHSLVLEPLNDEVSVGHT